jgi:hypothetical protein
MLNCPAQLSDLARLPWARQNEFVEIHCRNLTFEPKPGVKSYRSAMKRIEHLKKEI